MHIRHINPAWLYPTLPPRHQSNQVPQHLRKAVSLFITIKDKTISICVAGDQTI